MIETKRNAYTDTETKAETETDRGRQIDSDKQSQTDTETNILKDNYNQTLTIHTNIQIKKYNETV